MLSFKPEFLLSSFTFIKRLFSSSLLFAIGVVSSAHHEPVLEPAGRTFPLSVVSPMILEEVASALTPLICCT